MLGFRFKHVCIESFSLQVPNNEVTSAQVEDRLGELFHRLEIPFGTLEKLSGVRTRYFWDQGVSASQAATLAGRDALDRIGFDRNLVKALFSCSVTRDYFEPATASLVHRNLEFAEDSISMDISNACLGFSDGLMLLANLIESGVVSSGLVVSGENVSNMVEASIKRLLSGTNITREDLIKLLPTFTLGNGAAAFVLCHDSITTTKHRLLGAVARSASQFNQLCIGNADYSLFQSFADPIMFTDAQQIITQAAKLGGRTWQEASKLLGWSAADVDHIFCHQVGRQVNTAFYREMGLDIEKEFTVYQRFGNLVSAALPAALITGITEKNIKQGDKILLTGFGSGLNSVFTGIQW